MKNVNVTYDEREDHYRVMKKKSFVHLWPTVPKYLFHLVFILRTNTMLYHFTLTNDPAAGRFNSSMLTDLDMMVLLFEGLNEECRECMRKTADEYWPLHEWDCVTLSDIESVQRIDLPWRDHYTDAPFYVTGSMETQYLPRKLENFSVDDCQLRGTFSIATLPATLRTLCVERVPFSGTLDMAALPPSIEAVTFWGTDLEGPIDFDHLPPTLTLLNLYENSFWGSVSFAGLPRAMDVLILSRNNFSGSVPVKDLPQAMVQLDLACNTFAGEIDAAALPPSLEEFQIYFNHFEGVLDLREIRDSLIVIDKPPSYLKRSPSDPINKDLKVLRN